MPAFSGREGALSLMHTCDPGDGTMNLTRMTEQLVLGLVGLPRVDSAPKQTRSILEVRGYVITFPLLPHCSVSLPVKQS